MRSRGSVTGPLVLILVGVVFLLHALSANFRLGDLLAHYWPYGLILWGVVAFLEVCIRFRGAGPIPKNGVPGGAWALVVFIALIGSSAFEFQRPDNWLRQVGFESGMDAFGQNHQYPITTISKTVGANPRIIIEDFRGDAKISGADGDNLSLTGQKDIHSFDMRDADKANTQSPVEVITDGDTVTIRCHQDRVGTRSSVTTNLDLSIPRGATIQSSSSHGNVDISAIVGDLDVSAGSSSGIRLEDIGGNIKLQTRGSDSIHCNNVKGTLDLHGRGSNVELENIAGQVTVGGDYTGSVSLRALAKPVRLESMRTQLDARQVSGYVRLDRGSFDAKDLIGPVKLTAHSTDITLAGFTEGLDLNVDRGDVDLRPEHSAMGRIVVHARSGDIELAVPRAAQFALTANTQNGQVDNQFGDDLKESSQGRGAKLEGSVGSGPDVNLVTQHGTITVRKSSGDTKTETKAAEL
jgi:DUF4097 and DUF4098 domain-containing protein YvlB